MEFWNFLSEILTRPVCLENIVGLDHIRSKIPRGEQTFSAIIEKKHFSIHDFEYKID